MRTLIVFGLSAALASAVVACGDDPVVDPTGSGGAGAQGAGGDGAGAAGAAGPGGGGSGGGDDCGNGVVDAGEDCDGADLGGETCVSLGFGEGTLSCTATCAFDDSQCPPAPTCGDNVINGTDVCDGDDLGTATCESADFDGGTIACDSRCQLDTSACCDDACTDGETQCNGDAIETCALGASGCYEFSQTEDCSTTPGNTCNSTTTTCAQAGGFCGSAVDLTNATLPYQVLGAFVDDPSEGGSCDTSPTNVAWFKYTAPTTDTYVVTAKNNTSSSSWARIAVFEGDACTPLGLELACNISNTKSGAVDVDMMAGQSYLIMFYTDGNTWPMTDPEIDIAVASAGTSCDAPFDVSSATFPATLPGYFPMDPAVGGTCSGTTPANGVWFEYTAPATDSYVITATNATAASAYSRLAVFDGTTCAPLGTEEACTAVTAKTANAVAALTMGQTYLILFHTQADTHPMVDPTLDIEPFPAGGTCATAIDATAATLPITAPGNFIDDPATGSSCDTSPNNAVWFTYTAATTDTVSFRAENFTSGTAQSRVAVFEGACGALTEVACASSTTKSATTTFAATAGTTYTIMFYTNGNTNLMVDPELDIKLGVPLTWTCDPWLYDDGAVCDCGCGAIDADCGASPTAASCDTCDGCGTDQCALFLDPTDIGMCTFSPGNTCADPLPLVSGSFPWEGASNDFVTGSPSCTGFTANGVDRVHAVTLAAGETLTVELTPTSGDAAIYLITDCADSANTCLEGSDSSTPETITYTSVAGGTYYFVADRYSSGTTTAGYILNVTIQ